MPRSSSSAPRRVSKRASCPQRGYELVTIPRLPFPRRPNGTALRFPGEWRRTVAATQEIMTTRDISVVVGFGGYAAAPAYLAGHRAHLPIVVHEANARPGLGNRLGARYTDFVGVTFPGTRLRGGRLVGLPLRREIETLDRARHRADAYRELGLDARFPTLLVTGGSTGAARVNAGISAAVAAILGAGWQVLHLTGSRSPVEDPGLPGYHILEYSDRMDLALSAAELAVSRAGAATVCELAAVGLPAVLVPYAVGNGEQELNARGAVDIGGALLVPDAEFDARWVESTLVNLLDDRALVADMAARIASIGVRDGADRLVDLILEARDSAPQGRKVA